MKLVIRYFAGASLDIQIYFLSRFLLIHFKCFDILCQSDCQNEKEKFTPRLSVEYLKVEFSVFF